MQYRGRYHLEYTEDVSLNSDDYLSLLKQKFSLNWINMDTETINSKQLLTDSHSEEYT